MATISDYLSERGNLPFAEAPFNEVDNYIIAKIGTPNYESILPEDGHAVTVEQALSAYFERYGEAGNYLGALASPEIGPVLRRLPALERFRGLLLSDYVRRFLPERTEQFSALTVTLPGTWSYVSFRGTDDTLLGWKENFLMSVEGAVEAQKDAAAYLETAAAHAAGPLIVGGHSKGGNLAVYAAACAPEALQDRITDIYNNDGPGFLPEFYETEGYLRIRGRIHTLLPQYSLVGTLLTREKWASVVKSTRAGVAAHDGFAWEVREDAFVRCPNLSRSSLAFEETMDKVLEGMGPEEKREFVDEFFDALSAAGAETITDLTETRLRQAFTIAGSFRKGTGTKRFVLQVLEQMVKSYAARRLGLE